MKKYPIELGTLLFTMVEPHKGHEVEYNRWYERDHFYGGVLVGAYSFAGDRFVATRDLKALRYPLDSPMTPDTATGSYLAIYWVLKGHHDDWNRWSVDTVKNLHATGRMFAERTHIHTQLYDNQWSMTRTDTTTNIELALDRGYPGIIVNVGELNEGVTHAQMGEWMRTQWAPTAFASSWGPDVFNYTTLLPLLPDAPPDVPRVPKADQRFLQIHFVDHAPDAEWANGYGRFGADLESSGLAKHLWTAPFKNTVFGTDTFTDQLW